MPSDLIPNIHPYVSTYVRSNERNKMNIVSSYNTTHVRSNMILIILVAGSVQIHTEVQVLDGTVPYPVLYRTVQNHTTVRYGTVVLFAKRSPNLKKQKKNGRRRCASHTKIICPPNNTTIFYVS